VEHSDLGARDRARCRLVILRWVIKDHRRYVKDLVIAADQLLCNLSASIERGRLKDAGESL
jgi:hypothetical protein